MTIEIDQSKTVIESFTAMASDTEGSSKDLKALEERLETQRKDQLAEEKRLQQKRENLLILSSWHTSRTEQVSVSSLIEIRKCV